jgi:D-glycero-D-manno-heptose 1,7-bisphosphate phosphatase
MIKAVFFDRDGVINKSVIIDGKPYPPEDLSSVELFSGVEDAIIKLKNNGYKVFVVTNQPDISRGKIDFNTVKEINAYIDSKIKFDKIYCCIHDDKDNCHCRKPKPGMLLDAKLEWNIDLAKSFLIGDRWKDIEAGIAAGTRTILIESNYNEKKTKADFSFQNTVDAIEFILNLKN